MAKFLFYGSYTDEGLKGVMKDGGTRRKAAAEEVIRSAGGTLEAYYFAFGDHDFYAIADMPDNVSVTAASLTVNGSGAVTAHTVVLITPEEIDQAISRSVLYRPPGRSNS